MKPLLRGWSHVLAFTVVGSAGNHHDSVAGRIVQRANVAAGLRCRNADDVRYLVAVSLPACVTWTIDHAPTRSLAIFPRIAGAYTPIMAVALDGWQKTVVLCAAWGGAIIGMSLEWLPSPCRGRSSRRSTSSWLGQLRSRFPAAPQSRWRRFRLVRGGGLLYHVRRGVYALKRPDPWPRVFGFTRSSTCSPSPAPGATRQRSRSTSYPSCRDSRGQLAQPIDPAVH